MDTGAVLMEGYNPTPPYHLGVLADAEMLQAREAYRMKVEVDADWIVKVSQFNMMYDIAADQSRGMLDSFRETVSHTHHSHQCTHSERSVPRE